MKWEIERHSSEGLGERAGALPCWIEDLINAQETDQANDLVVLIESTVAPVNGPLKAGSSAVAACLVQGLISATSAARAEILFLLFQLAGGVVGGKEESELVRDVQQELELGLPIFCEIAETGTRVERFQCIDLLSLCARFNEHSRSRAVPTLRRIAALGDQEASTVAVELEDLEGDI